MLLDDLVDWHEGYFQDFLNLGVTMCNPVFSLRLIKRVPLINCQAIVISFLLFGDSDSYVEDRITRCTDLSSEIIATFGSTSTPRPPKE